MAACPSGTGCTYSTPPGTVTSRYSGSAAISVTGPRTPSAVPATTRTRTPSGRRTSGILSALISRYRGRLIFRRAGRLTQSWNPSISPSLGFGISSWRIPPPDLIPGPPPPPPPPPRPPAPPGPARPAVRGWGPGGGGGGGGGRAGGGGGRAVDDV